MVNTYAYQGYFRVAGKSQPGVVYAVRTGGLGVAWYYGVSGNVAANGVLQLQPDGSYEGPMTWYDKKGAQIDAGTARMTYKP